MQFILVILSGIGLSHLIVDGAILSRLRGWVVEKGPDWLKKLVTCYQCTGFWTGIITGVISGIFINEWGIDWLSRLLILPLLYGFTVSYLSMAAAALLNYLDQPYHKDS